MTSSADIAARTTPARRGGRTATACIILFALLTLLCGASLAIGQVQLSWPEVLQALSEGPQSIDGRIVWELRMPRVLGAILAGAALGLAGLLMQTLFRNPLADPWSLGLTAGGQFGAALVVVAGASLSPELSGALAVFAGLDVTLGAGLGALLIAALMASIARRVGTVTLLVLGLMLGFLSQGLISVLLHFTNRTQGRIFSSWNDGTFAGLQWSDFAVFAPPILLGTLIGIVLIKPLTALLLGEAYATSLGVNVPRLRQGVLAAVILLAAPVTAFCGPVIFVGLIVPHIARGLIGSARIGILVAPILLLGALLALAGDFVVHLPWRQHFLHLNAILAIIGAPIVIVMLLTSRSLRANAQ